MVLKDEDLFKKLEVLLMMEFRIEYPNFLVSCIFFRRTVCYQGNFGIESSGLESDSDHFNMLNWRETIANDHEDPKERAHFIYSQFCAEGALQQLTLNEHTLKSLPTRIKDLSNICDHVDKDLYREASNLVYDRLDKDLVPRLKARLNSCRRTKLRSCSINDRNDETSLPAGVVE